MRRLTLFLVLWALLAPTSAQMSSHLKEEFHNQEAYGVVVVDRLAGLRSALLNEEARILCFQSFGEQLDEESVREILEWVREGHTLWFYDPRQASHFGMRETFFDNSRFRNRPESGQLGGKKYGGVATLAVSIGDHPVQTGVGQVTIFMPTLEKKEGEEAQYGAIELAGDTKPLLQFTHDSPALVACRRDGRGLIVFKSLLWNEPLSGDRFQGNLLEFSAGYQVPGPAGVGRLGNPPGPEAEYIEGEPAEPVVTTEPGESTETPERNKAVEAVPGGKVGGWLLELRDGTVLQGVLEAKVVEFETGSSSLKLKSDEVESLELGSAVKLDRIVAKGKEQSGLLLTSPIRFRTDRGVEEFEKEDIQKLTRAPGVTEQQ